MPIAFEPPPIQAITASGSFPPEISAYWRLASRPITDWKSRTISGNGAGPRADPMM